MAMLQPSCGGLAASQRPQRAAATPATSRPRVPSAASSRMAPSVGALALATARRRTIARAARLAGPWQSIHASRACCTWHGDVAGGVPATTVSSSIALLGGGSPGLGFLSLRVKRRQLAAPLAAHKPQAQAPGSPLKGSAKASQRLAGAAGTGGASSSAGAGGAASQRTAALPEAHVISGGVGSVVEAPGLVDVVDGPAGGRKRKNIPAGSSRHDPRIVTAAAAAASAVAEAVASGTPAAPRTEANIVPTAGGGNFRALVLDSAYRPINVVSWFRALTMELSDKVDTLQYHDGAFAVSSYRHHPLPAVVRVREYMDFSELQGKVALTRRNLLLRDRHTCQYCGSRRDLTVDHVNPVCRGGRNTWDNLVTACQACNQRKGHKTLKQLGWRLQEAPREPTAYELGLVLGVSQSDMDAPPPEWAPWLAPFKERLERLRMRRAVKAGQPAHPHDQRF